MLKPDKNDPNYDAEMKRYQKDNGDWGEDHTRVDVMKRRGMSQPPAQPERR